MSQSRRSSLYESLINIGIGCGINFVANALILPVVGCTITNQQNFAIMVMFTGISLVRSYVIRRWFNARIHSMVVRLDK